MSYISKIFDRLDIQQIREFLLHGVECMEVDQHSYKHRLDCANSDMLKLLKIKYPETEELEKITREIYRFVGVYENVYMEIGLQSGAILAAQLFQNATSHQADKRK